LRGVVGRKAADFANTLVSILKKCQYGDKYDALSGLPIWIEPTETFGKAGLAVISILQFIFPRYTMTQHT